MKIIHCADLHLDSAMTANLTGDKRRERQAEILHTLERMVWYAEAERVDAILIAGDLFDTCHISQSARNTVYQAIVDHPGIDFYYLRGNHDETGFVESLELFPDNLKLFGSDWTGYPLKTAFSDRDIVVWGAEFREQNTDDLFEQLPFDPACFNIVMLHGQEMEYRGKDRTERIPLTRLRNQGIDYLALGHIHEYRKGVLDSRGTYCYSGCLEGRGFDECGEHGFVLLTIDERNFEFTHEFVPFAYRSFYDMEVDVTGVENTQEVLERIRQEWDRYDYDVKSMMRIVLVGELDVECELNMPLLKKQMEGWSWVLRIYDKTTWKADKEAYLFDESLKGEFVRTVMQSDLSEEDKASIIRYGILALSGEGGFLK